MQRIGCSSAKLHSSNCLGLGVFVLKAVHSSRPGCKEYSCVRKWNLQGIYQNFISKQIKLAGILHVPWLLKALLHKDYSLQYCRLLILVFLVIFKGKVITFPMEERFQSSGQLQRPFTIASTPLPVMSGAMAASSMRYGHWDTSHFMMFLMLRYDCLQFCLLH